MSADELAFVDRAVEIHGGSRAEFIRDAALIAAREILSAAEPEALMQQAAGDPDLARLLTQLKKKASSMRGAGFPR